ncbi:phosphatidylinositol-glycan-specific phospholipase D-like [Saccostrea echinata]|uniref:phosphatidylinositol-glycan-specific phospholipase D-like n=1 Tax=Saccostrea echinata TaxID=191078 RepID=UPI002A841919|nr:phosphatidylinositol-glycan-specific phospholipase D-like [Saccostrea echinata]
MKSHVIIFLTLAVVLHETLGAGIVTQLNVAQRAARFFDPNPEKNYSQIINHHSSAFYSGTPYPDAFYNELCEFGMFSNISDDTKSGPFLNATINYINKKPKPWDQATEKLFAFMMGMMSNQVSDSLWTSQGVDQGFLSAMGYTNFHGSVHKARKAGNFGGDIVVVYLLNVVDEIDEWYVPIDDLFEIYKEFYGSVQINKTLIESCSTLALVTAYAEITGNAELFTIVADTSDFIVDNLVEYFQGGLMDMAGWTNRKWHDAITMLENGTKACHIPHNPLFINCSKKQDTALMFYPKPRRQTDRPYTGDLSVSDFQIRRSQGAISIKPGHKLKKRLTELKSQVNKIKKQKLEPEQVGDDYHWKIYFNDYNHGSLLGKSLAAADIDGDGNVDVAIGAPGFSQNENMMAGRVYILYNSENGFPRPGKYFDYVDINNLTIGYNRIFDGEKGVQSRFGSSVTLLDVNLDGMVDLVVGASSYGSTSPLDYNGRVYVFYGSGKDRNQKPDITLTCQSKFCNLGYSLTSVDVNKDGHLDLVMGTPHYSGGNLTQSGMVVILVSASTASGTTIPVESLTRKIYGEQSYSWFGQRISGKNGTLLVNQPYFRICENPACPSFSESDQQAVGKLHVYNFGNRTAMTNMSIAGREAYDLAGHSSDFGDPFGNGSLVVAVGVPGADVDGEILTLKSKWTQAGKVILLKLEKGQLTEIASYESDRRYSRFGMRVNFADINNDDIDDLLIGSPYRNDDPSNLFSIIFDGKTYAFYGGGNFPVGNATNRRCERLWPCPDRNANHTFSSYLSDKNYFGDNFVTLPAINVTQLVISASICADDYDDYGSDSSYVYVFDTGSKLKET